MKVSHALTSRITCRAFLPDPVAESLIRKLLEAARFAPSGGNLQPWHLYVLTGDDLQRLIAQVAERMIDLPRGEETEYRVYPKNLKEPYFGRRHQCGEDLYAKINIAREDRAGRLAQFKRNFCFFDAPVGIFVYLDRTMGPPQWSDVGMFLQSLMLIAREYGLHSCAQEAWAQWHGTIAEHLNPPDEWMLFCGLGVGYMDESQPLNSLRTERAGVDEIATFKGFANPSVNNA